MGIVEWPFNTGWPVIQVDQKMTCMLYIVHNICPNSPTKKYNLLCVSHIWTQSADVDFGS